ncbi:hypothetical protein ACOMHN_039763 [Nucella lapillus]
MVPKRSRVQLVLMVSFFMLAFSPPTRARHPGKRGHPDLNSLPHTPPLHLSERSLSLMKRDPCWCCKNVHARACCCQCDGVPCM